MAAPLAPKSIDDAHAQAEKSSTIQLAPLMVDLLSDEADDDVEVALVRWSKISLRQSERRRRLSRVQKICVPHGVAAMAISSNSSEEEGKGINTEKGKGINTDDLGQRFSALQIDKQPPFDQSSSITKTEKAIQTELSIPPNIYLDPIILDAEVLKALAGNENQWIASEPSMQKVGSVSDQSIMEKTSTQKVIFGQPYQAVIVEKPLTKKVVFGQPYEVVSSSSASNMPLNLAKFKGKNLCDASSSATTCSNPVEKSENIGPAYKDVSISSTISLLPNKVGGPLVYNTQSQAKSHGRKAETTQP